MRNKPLPGLCQKSSPLHDGKVDLTKKSGLGPRANETNTVKYEQGNPLGIENPVALEKLYEKTEKPVMRSGSKNRTHGAGNTGNWKAHQFRK